MILTKEGYITSIGLLLPDNSTQQISPGDLRTSLTNLADSVHTFLAGYDIVAKNFASVDSRTTLVGDGAIAKRDLVGRSNRDNSAFGYHALNGNYDGVKNTAIGATALSCNLYGDQNVAVGFNAIAGNTMGSGNVGVGNFTLQSNKKGDFNIAIGHGAGSYIGEDSNYNFYLGAHAVDYDDLCDLEIASGNLPLLFGDLLNRKLGVGGVNTLHDFGTIQSSGDVSPSDNDAFNLGHGSYNWDTAFLSNLSYPSSGDFLFTRHTPTGPSDSNQYTQSTVFVMDTGGKIGINTATPSGDHGVLTVAGNIVPNQTHIHTLGTSDLMWDGFFNDVIISGQLHANDVNYNNINECLYDCKTLHLASSGFCDPDGIAGLTGGGVCGYLSDGSLDGAGFEVHSSGTGYVRDYRYIFKEPDQGLTCLEGDSNYARSRWQSNISIEVTDGQHIQTQRVLSDDRLSLATQSGCHGLFFRTLQNTSGNMTYIGSEDHVGAYTYNQSVNFIGPSGNGDYYLSVGTVDSGVSVGVDLATRISGAMVGFGLENHDDMNTDTNRFAVRTHNNTGKILESINVLRVSGLVGITNISVASGAAPITPATLFNIQGDNSCDVRFSASGLGTSNLDIIGNGNTRASGLQIAYNAATDIVDFSLIRPSGGLGQEFSFMSVINDGSIFIGQTPSGLANSGTIAVREQDSTPDPTDLFGKFYVKPKIVGTSQTQSLYFLDDGDNEFNLVVNNADSSQDGVYGDERGNTYAGTYSPASRPTLSAHHNTTLGHYALNAATTASGNIAIGSGSLQNTATGSENTVVGGGSLFTATAPNNNTIVGTFNVASGADAEGNIVIGHANLQKSLSTPTNCIVIGTGIKASGADTIANSTLAIGHGDAPLIYGSLSDRSFDIKDGSLSIGNSGDRHVLSVSHGLSGVRDVAVIDLKDNVNAAAVSGVIALRFTDSDGDTRQLMEFDHTAAGMSNTPSYVGPATADPRPFVKLEGDMLVRGCVKFADGTYIDSANVQSNFAGTGLRLASVSYGKVMHLEYINLKQAASLTPSVDTGSSYIAVSVSSGTSDLIGRMSLQTLTTYMADGTAAVSANCNHLFTNSNTSIDVVNNSGSVFIGCGAAIGATGWKNAVMIGTEAGVNANTPNPDLLGPETIETPAVFIGYRAGRDADNISNSIFIGTNAGYKAENSDGSIYIGQSAGTDNSMDDSIGIGEHALRGTTGGEGGKKNIEIVAGLLDNERLLYHKGNFTGRLNIQNSIAGYTDQRRVSIGDAVLTPDAPLSARLDHAISGHSGIHNIQTWYCNDTKVAQVTCSGDFESLYNGKVLPQTIEGFTMSGIPCPASYSSPTSGILKTKGVDFIDDTDVYIINRDSTMTVHSGAYVVATRVNREYRPIWVNCSGV
jgi:hypothetical protein